MIYRRLLAFICSFFACLAANAQGVTYSPNTVYTTKTQTLTNKTLTSAILTTPIISGSVTVELGANDLTLVFSAPAAPRTITFPDPGGPDSVLYAAAAQTVTNKIIGVSQLTGTLGTANGGTGFSSYTAGDLLTANDANALVKLAGSGTDGFVLTYDSTGNPNIKWAAAPSGSGDVVGPASATDRSIALFNGTTGKLLKDGVALGSAGQVLTSNGAGADPSFQSISGTGDVVGPASATDRSVALFDGTTGKLLKDGVALGSAGQVLTSNGAGADPSFQSVSGTGDVVGPASATDRSVALFDGTTGKLLKDGVALGSAGQVLTSNGAGADPSFQSVAGTGTVTSFSATPTEIFDVATPTSTPALSLDNQNANTSLRGPTSGSATTPAFRRDVLADFPDTSNFICGGRLSLNSTDATDSEKSDATTLFYLPYTSNIISLYNGSRWTPLTFASASLAVPSTKGILYDIFAFDSGGTVTLEAVAWSTRTATNNPAAGTNVVINVSDTSIFDNSNLSTVTVSDGTNSEYARMVSLVANTSITVDKLNNSYTTPTLCNVASNSSARRAINLTTQDGVLVKSGDSTRRYLGTIMTDVGATAGRVTVDHTGKIHLCNYYNRIQTFTTSRTFVNSWTYGTDAWREANGTHYSESEFCNSVVVCGGADGDNSSFSSDMQLTQMACAAEHNGAGGVVSVGIGTRNSDPFTGGTPGFGGYNNVMEVAVAGEFMTLPTSLMSRGIPGGGTIFFFQLERTSGSTATFYGDGATNAAGRGLTTITRF